MARPFFHPEFITRFQSILPESEQEAFFSALTRPSRKSLRVNTLKISVPDFRKLAKKRGWQLQPIPWEKAGFWIEREDMTSPLGSTLEHQTGLFYIQEASSMLPVNLFPDIQAKNVIDLAAAPGSKTTQLAAKMENTGTLFACDISPKRLEILKFHLEKMGVYNAFVIRKNALQLKTSFNNYFDAVLLDAPCSGDGMMSKKPDLIKEWYPQKIHEFAHIQKELIEVALHLTRDGGHIVYSTCTLAPEENEAIISDLLQKYPDYCEIETIPLDLPDFKKLPGITEFQNKVYHPAVKKCLRLWPHISGTNGFFACLIRKKKPLCLFEQRKSTRAWNKNEHGKILGNKEKLSLFVFLKKQFGAAIELTKRSVIRLREHTYFLQSSLAEGIYADQHFAMEGLPILTTYKNTLNLTHASANLFGKHFTKQVLEIDEKTAFLYAQGKDLSVAELDISSLQEGQIILRHNDLILGLGLYQKNKIKNQLPREYVIRR